MTPQDDTEWKTITRDDKKRVMRRRGRSTKANAQEHQSINQTSHHVDDYDVLCSYILSCQEALGVLLEKIMTLWDDETIRIQQIVCYGVGNFSKTSGHFFSASLWQLALALSLQTAFDVPLLYYDPCTTEWEILSNNDKGERKSAHTLFFMPHCPSGLYENVLWSNWGHLDSILLLGNSLKSYSEALQFDGPCIQAIQPWLQQDIIQWRHVNAPGDVEGAFNDTFLTQVRPHKRELLSRTTVQYFARAVIAFVVVRGVLMAHGRENKRLGTNRRCLIVPCVCNGSFEIKGVSPLRMHRVGTSNDVVLLRK